MSFNYGQKVDRKTDNEIVVRIGKLVKKLK